MAFSSSLGEPTIIAGGLVIRITLRRIDYTYFVVIPSSQRTTHFLQIQIEVKNERLDMGLDLPGRRTSLLSACHFHSSRFMSRSILPCFRPTPSPKYSDLFDCLHGHPTLWILPTMVSPRALLLSKEPTGLNRQTLCIIFNMLSTKKIAITPTSPSHTTTNTTTNNTRVPVALNIESVHVQYSRIVGPHHTAHSMPRPLTAW